MKIQKFRKIKVVEPQNWKDITNLWGIPTIMFHQLFEDDPPNMGDKITLDLRVLIERDN